ncbi:unnamed protein product [Moneuplotes crassus]|uniref:Uncharacterized protein n=1 Tax=Euplotes crassus TaxID=5936 RepID=A0AAD1XL08_EUPCR|nr:unnamed protein product [Moneuplotes crassus]
MKAQYNSKPMSPFSIRMPGTTSSYGTSRRSNRSKTLSFPKEAKSRHSSNNSSGSLILFSIDIREHRLNPPSVNNAYQRRHKRVCDMRKKLANGPIKRLKLLSKKIKKYFLPKPLGTAQISKFQLKNNFSSSLSHKGISSRPVANFKNFGAQNGAFKDKSIIVKSNKVSFYNPDALERKHGRKLEKMRSMDANMSTRENRTKGCRSFHAYVQAELEKRRGAKKIKVKNHSITKRIMLDLEQKGLKDPHSVSANSQYPKIKLHKILN